MYGELFAYILSGLCITETLVYGESGILNIEADKINIPSLPTTIQPVTKDGLLPNSKIVNVFLDAENKVIMGVKLVVQGASAIKAVPIDSAGNERYSEVRNTD